MFSKLYNEYKQDEKWKEIAKIGIEFLEKFGRKTEINKKGKKEAKDFYF